MAAEGEGGQDERLRHGDGLHDEEQPALVRAVGDQPRPGAEHQHRPELGRRQRTKGDPVVGELQHQQGLGHQGQPVAHLGDQLAPEEEPEVTDVERPEGLAGGDSDAGHGVSLVRASRTSRAAASRAR